MMDQALYDELPRIAHATITATADRATHSITSQALIDCDAQTLFAVWSDVANWHRWDPDTRQATLSGSFAAGAVGRLTPRKGMSVKLLIEHADPLTGFTVACPVLGSRMRFAHRMQAHNKQLLVTHSLHMQGWLRGLLFRSVAQDVLHGLPLTMTRLKVLCERLADRAQIVSHRVGQVHSPEALTCTRPSTPP